ncbi:MAG: hypothetical protein V4663_02085 [Bacteroidota bacterium]
MSIISKFSGVVRLKPDESRSFKFLFLLSLITGIALSFYFVAVNTFLIQKTSVSNLPYAYIISGLAGVLLIKIYQARQQKNGIIRSYREFLCAFSILSVVVFFAYVKFGANPAYAVYLAYFGFLFNMPFTIIFALSFSGICANLYNLSQSKRLLALVGTGEILASIAGYLFAPLVSKLMGSPNYLLPVAAACTLPAFYPIFKLVSENREKLSHQPIVKSALKKLNLRFFMSNSFYLLIAGVSVFSVAAVYFVDYSYLISVRLMASYSGLEIAAIVGVFFSLVKVGELIFSFLSGHILSSKGVKFSILIMPLLLVGCFIFAAVGGGVFHSNPVFILCFIFLAKFVERVIRKAITTPAIKVLYQVTGNDRLRIEATIEGLFNQVATVLSGIVLLIISALISREDPQYFLTVVAIICFVIFLLWSLVSLKLYESYKKKIWNYLTEIKTTKSPKQGLGAQQKGETNESGQIGTVLSKASKTIQAAKMDKNIRPLAMYVPSLLHYADGNNTNQLFKKLAGTYYTNDNFFYRLAVIRYLKSSGQKFTLQLFKELWDLSDLALKFELIQLYNQHGEETTTNDLFYFEELCQQFSDELIYALSLQNDLQNIDDQALQIELKQYCDFLVNVLFELLKVLFEPSAIQVIYEIIIADDHQDMESKLFALELLDNILSDDLKNKLIPIFEPAPFEQKIGKLQQFVPVSAMKKQFALKELLMKDFTLVNARLKECCLICYHKLGFDKKLIDAFYTSTIKNLQARAAQLLVNEPIQVQKELLLMQLEETYQLSKLQLMYLYNHALYTLDDKKIKAGITLKDNKENPYQIIIETDYGQILFDVFGLALCIDHRYSGA